MFILTPAFTLNGSWIIDHLSLFVISKLLSAITQPMFWLALWCALALLILKRWRRVSTAMLWAGLVMLGLLGFAAGPDALLKSLESHYPIPNAQGVDKHVGMIVLGGAIDRPEVYKAHGQVPLGDAAERMIEPVAIMRNHPKLQLVFTGGEGRLLASGVSEAELAKVFLRVPGGGHEPRHF